MELNPFELLKLKRNIIKFKLCLEVKKVIGLTNGRSLGIVGILGIGTTVP